MLQNGGGGRAVGMDSVWLLEGGSGIVGRCNDSGAGLLKLLRWCMWRCSGQK